MSYFNETLEALETESATSTTTSIISDEDDCYFNLYTLPLPMEEKKRLQFLRDSNIFDLDTKEESYSVLTSFVTRKFTVPISVIGMVDLNRVFIKSKLEWNLDEKMNQKMSFLAFTILENSPGLVVIPDLSQDPRFASYPFVKGPAHIRFYAGAAIVCDGIKLGSFCIFDTELRPDLKVEDLTVLQEFAGMIADIMVEKRKRYITVQQEQIKYLIGITNNLKIPKDKARLQFQEMLNIKERLTTTKDNQILINHLSDLLPKFFDQVTEMTQQLEMILMLAQASSESNDRSLNVTNQSVEDVVLNQFLHSESQKDHLLYHTIPTIMNKLQENLKKCPLCSLSHFSTNHFLWKFKKQNKDLDKVFAIDMDLIALIMHALLKPYFHEQSNPVNHFKYSIQCSIQDLSDAVAENNFHIPANPLTVIPITNSSSLFKKLKQFIIDIIPFALSEGSENGNDYKDLDLATSLHFTRSPSFSDLKMINYSEQNILRDILRSSYGDIDIYFPISPDLNQDIYNLPLAYRIRIICATKTGRVSPPKANFFEILQQNKISLPNYLRDNSFRPIDTKSQTKTLKSKSMDVLENLPSVLLPMFTLGLIKQKKKAYSP